MSEPVENRDLLLAADAVERASRDVQAEYARSLAGPAAGGYRCARHRLGMGAVPSPYPCEHCAEEERRALAEKTKADAQTVVEIDLSKETPRQAETWSRWRSDFPQAADEPRTEEEERLALALLDARKALDRLESDGPRVVHERVVWTGEEEIVNRTFENRRAYLARLARARNRVEMLSFDLAREQGRVTAGATRPRSYEVEREAARLERQTRAAMLDPDGPYGPFGKDLLSLGSD